MCICWLVVALLRVAQGDGGSGVLRKTTHSHAHAAEERLGSLTLRGGRPNDFVGDSEPSTSAPITWVIVGGTSAPSTSSLPTSDRDAFTCVHLRVPAIPARPPAFPPAWPSSDRF